MAPDRYHHDSDDVFGTSSAIKELAIDLIRELAIESQTNLIEQHVIKALRLIAYSSKMSFSQAITFKHHALTAIRDVAISSPSQNTKDLSLDALNKVKEQILTAEIARLAQLCSTEIRRSI